MLLVICARDSSVLLAECHQGLQIPPLVRYSQPVTLEGTIATVPHSVVVFSALLRTLFVPSSRSLLKKTNTAAKLCGLSVLAENQWEPFACWCPVQLSKSSVVWCGVIIGIWSCHFSHIGYRTPFPHASACTGDSWVYSLWFVAGTCMLTGSFISPLKGEAICKHSVPLAFKTGQI